MASVAFCLSIYLSFSTSGSQWQHRCSWYFFFFKGFLLKFWEFKLLFSNVGGHNQTIWLSPFNLMPDLTNVNQLVVAVCLGLNFNQSIFDLNWNPKPAEILYLNIYLLMFFGWENIYVNALYISNGWSRTQLGL